MPWLGESRGYLTDWITQRWVQLTGQTVDLEATPWLQGPVGSPRGIGKDFFSTLAAAEGLELRRNGPRGLISDFSVLEAPDFDPAAVNRAVVDFYKRTSCYDLDSWAQWCGIFRPFGWLIAMIFSRRLQQLNVPLSGLDTSRGVTSDVVQLTDPATAAVRYTAWLRELRGSGDVLYAGSYSVADIPGHKGACVKVVFPLPNGNAIVLMRPVLHEDGSISIASVGSRFGEPGFYFTVAVPDKPRWAWARYIQGLQETIHVYPDMESGVRADHVFKLWRATFLRIHYRLRQRNVNTDNQLEGVRDAEV